MYDEQVDCVLLQDQPNQTEQQSNISLGHKYHQKMHMTNRKKECFEIVYTILYLRLYLKRQKAKIRSDYESLYLLFNTTDATAHFAQWPYLRSDIL